MKKWSKRCVIALVLSSLLPYSLLCSWDKAYAQTSGNSIASYITFSTTGSNGSTWTQTKYKGASDPYAGSPTNPDNIIFRANGDESYSNLCINFPVSISGGTYYSMNFSIMYNKLWGFAGLSGTSDNIISSMVIDTAQTGFFENTATTTDKDGYYENTTSISLSGQKKSTGSTICFGGTFLVGDVSGIAVEFSGIRINFQPEPSTAAQLGQINSSVQEGNQQAQDRWEQEQAQKKEEEDKAQEELGGDNGAPDMDNQKEQSGNYFDIFTTIFDQAKSGTCTLPKIEAYGFDIGELNLCEYTPPNWIRTALGAVATLAAAWCGIKVINRIVGVANGSII